MTAFSLTENSARIPGGLALALASIEVPTCPGCFSLLCPDHAPLPRCEACPHAVADPRCDCRPDPLCVCGGAA